jgi:hypothetical protein
MPGSLGLVSWALFNQYVSGLVRSIPGCSDHLHQGAPAFGIADVQPNCRSGNIYKYPKGNYQAGALLAMRCMALAARYCSIFGALPDTPRE